MSSHPCSPARLKRSTKPAPLADALPPIFEYNSPSVLPLIEVACGAVQMQTILDSVSAAYSHFVNVCRVSADCPVRAKMHAIAPNKTKNSTIWRDDTDPPYRF